MLPISLLARKQIFYLVYGYIGVYMRVHVRAVFL